MWLLKFHSSRYGFYLWGLLFLIYCFITYSVACKQCSGSEETFLSVQAVQLSHSFKVVLLFVLTLSVT